jgi:PAS domain S-box-containing protein
MEESKTKPRQFNDLRIRAEKLLDKNPEAIQSMLPEDIQKLVHELNIHQIELEMQNEELRRAQEEIVESRNRYSDLYDFAPIGYFIFDKAGLIVEVNLTGADLLGIERGKLIKRGFSRFIVKKFQDEFYSHRQSVFKTKTRQNCELKLVKKEGTEFYARLESIPIQDHEGNFIQLRSSITDISEQKQAVEKIQEEAYLNRALLDNIPGVALLIRPETREIVLANEAALKVDARPGEQCFVTWGKRNEPCPWCLAPELWATGKAKNIEVEVSGTIYDTFWVPVTEDLYLHYAFDITERKKAEDELKYRKEEIEELNANLEKRVQEEVEKSRQKDFIMMHQSRLAAMGEMIGHIAHQWKQPLNALNILMFNLKDGLEDLEPDKEELYTLIPTGEKLIGKMSKTIDDFRNFFKPDRQKEEFSINKNIKDTLSIFEADLKYHKISLVMNEGEEITIVGFSNEYSQVVLNIISNAKDAIIAKGIGGEIKIDLFCEDDSAIVGIKDNAGGIPEKIINNIFDPYFTTKERKKGTGIGLYMSKLIIENHMGGRIDAQNIDAGAEFRIITPIT